MYIICNMLSAQKAVIHQHVTGVALPEKFALLPCKYSYMYIYKQNIV